MGDYLSCGPDRAGAKRASRVRRGAVAAVEWAAGGWGRAPQGPIVAGWSIVITQ